jgi:LemA protein
VALRNAVGGAWRAVDDLLAARALAVDALLAALREPLVAETAALDTLRDAGARVDAAARALRAQPVRADAAAALVVAEAAFGPACTRVLALAEAESSLRGAAAVQAPAATLAELAPRLGFARQAFNEAVAAHNDAIALWPTRWLARLYAFAPAGPV